MKPLLLLETSELLPLTGQFPPNWNGSRLPGSQVHSYTGSIGVIVIQEFVAPQFLIRYFALRLYRTCSFLIPMDKGFGSLVSLKGGLDFSPSEGKALKMKEGEFLLFQSGEHGLKSSFSPATDYQMVSTTYQPEIYSGWSHLFPKLKSIIEPAPFPFLSTSMPSRVAVFDAIRSLFYERMEDHLRESYYHLKIRESFFLLSAQVHHHSLGEQPSPWERIQVAKVRDLMLQDIRIHYSNKELADAVSMDRSALNKAFRLEYGMGLHEYLIHARFQRAKELLLEGRTLKQVAKDTGYSRSSTFSFEFRKFFGYSPVDFQKDRIKS